MEDGIKKVLITGSPGIGKTTLIKEIGDLLGKYQPTGFYTEEIRRAGHRVGFKLVGFDERREILAHVDRHTTPKVGKYGVNIQGFERFLTEMNLHPPFGRLIIIDEIGKMECHSPLFRSIIQEILASPAPCIATIAERGDMFIESLKRRHDVRLVELTKMNRNSLSRDIIAAMEKRIRGYDVNKF